MRLMASLGFIPQLSSLQELWFLSVCINLPVVQNFLQKCPNLKVLHVYDADACPAIDFDRIQSIESIRVSGYSIDQFLSAVRNLEMVSHRFTVALDAKGASADSIARILRCNSYLNLKILNSMCRTIFSVGEDTMMLHQHDFDALILKEWIKGTRQARNHLQMAIDQSLNDKISKAADVLLRTALYTRSEIEQMTV